MGVPRSHKSPPAALATTPRARLIHIALPKMDGGKAVGVAQLVEYCTRYADVKDWASKLYFLSVSFPYFLY